MSARVYVPLDAASRSVGADEVAEAIVREAARRGEGITLVRTGSRGMLWLEPLVEVQLAEGRVGYGPVTAEDVPALFDAGLLRGGEHRLRQGLVASLPWMERQDRLVFQRVGVIDPLSFQDWAAHGGGLGLRAALEASPEQILEAVAASGLRGRGGAGFPTGIKWKTVRATASEQRYVVCNADEGDSGTFSDRMLMEGDPLTLIEGMVIAGIAVGADMGYVYLRSEYPNAEAIFLAALEVARREALIGPSVLGSGHRFEIALRRGAGAYVCGEETALLQSLEGKRGEVRPRPPLPAVEGLWGKPTALNNVITLASVPSILARGAADYAGRGVGRSRGTLPIQLAGNVARGGLIELPFGVSLRELVYGYGGGTRSGRPVRAVQVGGPLGAFIPEHKLDVPLDYEALAERGAIVGHGGIVVYDDTIDMAAMARYAMAFCAIESCGKCTPCRIGSTRGAEVIDKIVRGQDREANVALLRSLCDTMTHASLCALGGMTAWPVLSALDHFPEDFTPRVRAGRS